MPTKLWLNRSASLRASASTCCARGVKLFIASSLITTTQNAVTVTVCPIRFPAAARAWKSVG